MKTLNLDALAKINRTITLGGKEHVVRDMTVENFIETTKETQALGDNPSVAVQLESTIKSIIRSVPTLDEKTLRDLSLEQLTTVIRFIRGDELFADGETGGEAEAAEDAAGK